MVLHRLQGVTSLHIQWPVYVSSGALNAIFAVVFSPDVSYPPDRSYETHINERSGVALVRNPIP